MLAWSVPQAVRVVHGVEAMPVALGKPKTQYAAVYRRLSGSGVSTSTSCQIGPGDIQRNHMVSLSLPCEKVLVCRHVMQFLNLVPAALE
jgi:hypothetical protein